MRVSSDELLQLAVKHRFSENLTLKEASLSCWSWYLASGAYFEEFVEVPQDLVFVLRSMEEHG